MEAPQKPKWPVPKKPVKFISKDQFWVFRLMAWFLNLTGILDKKTFYERFWTTYDHTIGVRTTIDMTKPGWQGGHERTIKHENIHIRRKEKLGGYIYSTLYVGPSVTVWLPAAILSSTAHIFLVYPWLWTWAILGVLVLCLPLSVGFAWGRFFIEREAYLVQIWEARDRRADEIHRIVETLHKNYARTWPKEWMRKWFFKECAKRNWPV